MTPKQEQDFQDTAALAALGPLLTLVNGDAKRAASLAWRAADALLAERKSRENDD